MDGKQKLVISVQDGTLYYKQGVINPETCSLEDALEIATDVIERFYDEFEDLGDEGEFSDVG